MSNTNQKKKLSSPSNNSRGNERTKRKSCSSTDATSTSPDVVMPDPRTKIVDSVPLGQFDTKKDTLFPIILTTGCINVLCQHNYMWHDNIMKLGINLCNQLVEN